MERHESEAPAHDQYVEQLNAYIEDPNRDEDTALREVVDGVGIVLNDANDALPTPSKERRDGSG